MDVSQLDTPELWPEGSYWRRLYLILKICDIS